MFSSRKMVYGGLLVAAILTVVVGRQILQIETSPPPIRKIKAGSGLDVEVQTRSPKIGGPFSLVDHDGKAVTDADYRGKFMIIFFGYTFCPDVCPTSLSAVSGALDILGPLADRYVPIFVSVDPDRDTAAALKEFVGHFHPRLIGMTGTKAQILDAARHYRVYFAKAQEEGSDPSDYLVDHSAITYVMGPDGKYRFHFGHGTDPEVMAQHLKGILEKEDMEGKGTGG